MNKHKHDSWVFLIDNSPFDSIKPLFPQGFPVRDPFPIKLATDPNTNESVPLWTIDTIRLEQDQLEAIVILMAQVKNVEASLVYEHVQQTQSLGLAHKWVRYLECGIEGITRQNELAKFLEKFDDNPSQSVYREFIEQQIRDWVEGNKKPSTYPRSIEEIHPSLRSSELEKAINQRNFENFLARKNYSVLDILLGNALSDFVDEEKS